MQTDLRNFTEQGINMARKPQSSSAASEERNITVRMDTDLLARLDECRRRQRDIPNRSEMLRRLITLQLDALEIPVPDPESFDKSLDD